MLTPATQFGRRFTWGALALAGLAALACGPARADDTDKLPAIDYARDIRPILAAHCYECHGPKKSEGGLRLNARDTAFAGGDSGQKAIVPADPAASRLIKVISGADELKMPPDGEGKPLTAEQIERITRWVKAGANWPAEADLPSDKPDHWAWKPPVKASLPAVQQRDWPRRPIDAFILAGIEKAGLKPAPEADRYTLARRVYLDLVGLPPTIDETEAFVHDTRPDAYERLVDRALADPGFGERWARVWLDLARYADSKGYGSDPLRTIWRYRDWVIDAFNRDMPFDRFTVEQLAGDLLPQPTADQILATAFHRNTMANDEGGTDDEEFRVAAVKDRIETSMQIWMGLTMGCAKCHSHKFDPITQREYYQGYAFFDQTEDADRNDEEPKVASPTRLQQAQIADRRLRIAALQKQLSAPPGPLDAGVAQWEQQARDLAASWKPLEPKRLSALGETNLEVLGDHSIRAIGSSPQRQTYELEFTSDLRPITALRVEALTDPSLPQHGPGRSREGNVVLNEVRLAAGPQRATPLAGRYVRIELPGKSRILSLAEVQVFHGNENLAPQGKATQSSTGFDGRAELAIDNQTDGDFNKKSVTHTNEQADPWWELDLGQTRPLERIAIWNRTDSALESRLKGFKLSVLDDKRQVAWQRTTAEAPQPSMQNDLLAPSQVEWAEASTDFAQAGFSVDKAIDGSDAAASGWAIGPQAGASHNAVFRPKRPIEADGPLALRLTLVQSHGGHTLGRFRVSATTAPAPPSAIPLDIAGIMSVPPDKRSPEQRRAIEQHVWSQSPQAASLRTEIAAVEKQVKDLEQQIAAIPIMRELPADQRRVTHMMVKGNFRQVGDEVTPAVPAAFHSWPAGAPVNRLGLARWLVDRRNPLVARVTVNRLWAQLFGTGIVATEEDFGTQGLAPTQPEVLDYLAVELMDDGWSIKDILRQIVTSATYRQASSPDAAAAEKDPNNRLLAHGPRFRLEAEMVRDQALAASGLLSRKLGGESVYPPQPPNLWRAAFNGQRTWATSTGEDRYRRGLYTYWRRTVPYPSMAAFDAPSREICTLRRVSTNTPLQAFVTLNDPVFVECAQALARRIIQEGGSTPEDRAAYALRLSLGRQPAAEQIKGLTDLYRSQCEHYRADAKAAAEIATDPLGPLPAGVDAAELAAWTVVSNVILNLDGVLTKR